MKIDIENTGELVLLQKMISYIKFVANDDESAFMSGSPFINSLSDKITNELNKSGKGSNRVPEIVYQNNYERIKKFIERKLSNHPGWNDIGLDAKRKLVLNMIYPFKPKESEIDEIIDAAEPPSISG